MNPFGQGFHLNRSAFDELLRRCVKDYQSEAANVVPSGSVGVVRGRFKAVERDSSGNWAIHVDVDGDALVFHTKWLVDATGRRASLATKVRCIHRSRNTRDKR